MTAVVVLALSLVAGSFPPAEAPVAVAELAGVWAGTLTHAGETVPLALELEPGTDGKVLLTATGGAENAGQRAPGSRKIRASSGAGRLVRTDSYNPLAPMTDAIPIARAFGVIRAEGAAP